MNDVTIVIPVYNSEKYIERCINSILNQTYQNVDILVINDGSIDRSEEILNSFVTKYKNIKVINQENIGVAKTRNKAIKLANTEYIMFVDNDDFIDNDYAETYLKKIQFTKADIVIGGYRRVNVENKVLFKQKLSNTSWSKYIVLAPWAKIYRRDFLLKNNINFLDYQIGEDVYFNLSAYAKHPKIEIINYIGYNWFFNTKSVSNTTQRGIKKDIDIRFLLNKIIDEYNDKDDLLQYYLYRYFIWYMLFSGRQSTSENFIKTYNINKKWFKDRNIKNKITIFSSQIKGESLKNRLIINMFILIEKMHLINFFAKIYCKAKEK